MSITENRSERQNLDFLFSKIQKNTNRDNEIAPVSRCIAMNGEDPIYIEKEMGREGKDLVPVSLPYETPRQNGLVMDLIEVPLYKH